MLLVKIAPKPNKDAVGGFRRLGLEMFSQLRFSEALGLSWHLAMLRCAKSLKKPNSRFSARRHSTHLTAWDLVLPSLSCIVSSRGIWTWIWPKQKSCGSLCFLCLQVAGVPLIFCWSNLKSFFNGGCHSTVGGLKASCVKFQRNKCAVSESRSSRGPGSAPVRSQGHCRRLCLQACLCRSFAHRESTGTYVVLRLCESRWAMMLSPIQKVNRVAYR